MDSVNCIDIEDVDASEGAVVHQWEYLGNDNQLWHFNDDGTIVSKLSGYCLRAGV